MRSIDSQSVKVKLFGEATIQFGSKRPSEGRRQVLEVLAFLILHGEKPIEKAALRDAVFGRTHMHGPNLINQALGILRKLYPDRASGISGYGPFRFDATGLDIDVVKFYEMVRQAEQADKPIEQRHNLIEAIGLYQEPVAPFSSKWVDRAQARVREKVIWCHRKLGDIAAGEGDFEEAEKWFEAARVLKPDLMHTFEDYARYCAKFGRVRQLREAEKDMKQAVPETDVARRGEIDEIFKGALKVAQSIRFKQVPTERENKASNNPNTGRSDNYRASLRRAHQLTLENNGQAAEAIYKDIEASAVNSDDIEYYAEALLGLCTIAMNRRDNGYAEKCLEKAKGLSSQIADNWLRVNLLRCQANMQSALGQLLEAERSYQEAIAPDCGDDTNLQELLCVTRSDLVLFYCRTGRPNLAKAELSHIEEFVRSESEEQRDESRLTLVLSSCDVGVSYALCIRDDNALARWISFAEQEASTHRSIDQIAHLLQELGVRAGGLKAFSMGIQCCEASIRLARLSKLNDLIIASEHTIALLLSQQGEYERAESLCLSLLRAAKQSSHQSLYMAVAQLLAVIRHKRLDFEGAVAAAQEAVSAAGSDLSALAIAEHGLGRSLCDAGRVSEALAHIETAYQLSQDTGASPEFQFETLALLADAAALAGDTLKAESAVFTLNENTSDEFAEQKELVVKRITACNEIRRRFASIESNANERKPGEVESKDNLLNANSSILHPLSDWWREATDEGVLDRYKALVSTFEPYGLSELQPVKHRSVLYDYWGRGNMARVIMNHRRHPGNLNPLVEARSLEDIRQAILLFSTIADVLVVLWKGPIWSSQVLTVVPAFNGVIGGAGYKLIPTQEFNVSTERSGDWIPAVGYGSFLPDDVISFLSGEALPLVLLGRLIVIPASAVGCIHTAHGPFESLFAAICNATPAVGESPSAGSFPIGWLPYFPDASLADLIELIQEQPEGLKRMRLLLLDRTSKLAIHKNSYVASKHLEIEIADALAHLSDVHIRHGRKHGLTAEKEHLGTSSISYSEDELVGAAWQQAGGASLLAAGRTDELISASKWLPVFTLSSRGLTWRVGSTSERLAQYQTTIRPEPNEAIGGWLAPPDFDVELIMMKKRT